MDLLRRGLAEAAGTALLVLIGCGAIVVDEATGRLGTAGVALAFFVAVALPVWLLGRASGAHLNPAVTLALASRGRLPWRDVPTYVAAQVAGALAAALLLRIASGAGGLGTTHVAPGFPTAGAFAAEAIATAVLLVVVLLVATGRSFPGPLQAPAIGATVGLAAYVVGPWTGASLNPARSIGPALVAGTADVSLLLYVTAPVFGAVVAAYAVCALAPPDVCCAEVVQVTPFEPRPAEAEP